MVERSKLIIVSVLMLLTGCATKDEEIEFVEDLTIPAGSVFNSAGLVKTVNGQKITQFNLDGDRIISGEDTVICPLIDTSRLGSKTIQYIYNNHEIELTVEIVDASPPVFQEEKNELTVQAGISKDDLIEMMKVKDEYSSFSVILEGEMNLCESGTYHVAAIAKDEEDNEARKEYTIIVREESKQQDKITSETESVSRPAQTSSGHSDDSAGFSHNDQNKQESSKPTKTEIHLTAENRRFLFSDGYEYESCYQAAVTYAQQMIKEHKANGYNCNPIRNDRQEYVGYEVVFY